MMANHRWRAATERTVAVDRTSVASYDPGRFLTKLRFCPTDGAMRTAVSLFAITVVSVGCFRSTLGDEPGPKQPAAVTASTRQYVVACWVVSDNPNELSFAVPKVTAWDGVKASISDTSQCPFVVAVKTEGGVDTPVKQSITEGTTLEMTVRGHGDDKAILDLTVELCSAKDAPSENGRSVRVSFEKGRLIECVSLGKKTKAPMHGWSIEVVVKAISADGTESTSAPEVPAADRATTIRTATGGNRRPSSRANRQR
jgi:hypothetical protein